MSLSSPLSSLEPTHSAVVEACAGSGKTWLLVSRMLRLMLAGADPSELLAITFTRKAAEEMRARLDDWLRELAVAPEEDALAFLEQRGLSPGDARAALPRARGLLEAVLLARPGPLITTFHGWFFHLLDRAPLDRRVPGELVEHPALLGEEAWFDFAESLRQKPSSPETLAFMELARHFPLSSVRELLDSLLARRTEWWAYGGEGMACCVALEQELGISEDEDVLRAFFSTPSLFESLMEYHALVARNGAAGLAGDVERAGLLETVVPSPTSTDQTAAFKALQTAFLTQKGDPLSRKPGPALDKRLGPGGAARYLELHYKLADDVIQCGQRLAEQLALKLNRLGLTASLAYLDHFQLLKQGRGVLDFTDAELEAARLLSDDDTAAAVLMKLDTRWKHLLLDEFQDTNPLQWRILRAWLEAYGEDGSRPTVFLVGDPKQSIYRFRRAEPRLFHAAGAWLGERYGAQRYPQNETRRCAPRVVAWVNAVFGNRPDYPGFEHHTAHQTSLPGWCEVFLAEPDAGATPDAGAYRAPLTTPPVTLAPKRADEAAWVAERIQRIVGALEINDSTPRPARYGDITLLYAKRAEIQVFEDAFKAAGIPFITDRRGELLSTLEARDIIALLTSLVDPRDDLSLAHVLRTPIFGLSDGDLLQLSQGADCPWREKLSTWATDPMAPEPVRRAARLLGAWQGLAGAVPVHDLLDRIYHQGNVSAHYARCVPPHMQATVQANLDGLLSISLSLSGARYPSLPRFLDELRSLRDKAGREGPDEPPAGHGDRVRMLTIHSAKGLESPVVFLIKADAPAGQDAPYGVLMDWPPEAERPAHFSLYGPKDWRGPGRDPLFQKEKEQAATENLNLLYVAMTRARQALFVSGIRSEKGGAGWLDELAQARERTDMGSLPEMAWRDANPRDEPEASSLPDTPVAAPATPVGNRREPESAQAAFGTLLHAWLEHRSNGLDEPQTRALLQVDTNQANAISAMAANIFSHPELAPAYDPAQFLAAHNELEFLDEAGGTNRMDRLVEFDREVWVLDYKSGGLDEPDALRRALPHGEQMDRYRRAAQALFPGKPVRTALVFTDGLVHWL